MQFNMSILKDYNDFDDDYDDIGTLFILDEMDREDERMNYGGGMGCLSVLLLIISFPVILIYLVNRL